VDSFLNNPAGRLYRFFEHCAAGNQNQAIIEAWRMYLALPDGTPRVEVLRAIAPFFSLPELIRVQTVRAGDRSAARRSARTLPGWRRR
jgi:hypothetical protein